MNNQKTLFESQIKEIPITPQKDISQWGTFKDSLKAPVHRWFTYPAGFSYKAVENSLDTFGIKQGQVVYDPFMGSGTTNIVAKTKGINSYGIEAHPFVIEITKTKLFWDIHIDDIFFHLHQIKDALKNWSNHQPNNLKTFLENEFPELILKCFLEPTLYELLGIRNSLQKIDDINLKRFFRTALICTLRDVSIAATGWPYIAPNKIKITSMSKKGFETFEGTCEKMIGDLQTIRKNSVKTTSNHEIVLGDARQTNFPSQTADYIFTSPPYLNNFDYADRTRLEMYFMGEAKNWSDISKNIRTKLMTSATTQISRSDPKYTFGTNFKVNCAKEYEFLKKQVEKLAVLRTQKGGKKSYDLLVIGYFNDEFVQHY